MHVSKAEVKYFYSRSDGSLSKIPDPRDYANLERYAIMTCIVYLLEHIFRTKDGLRAYNNHIPDYISSNDIAKMQKMERKLDKLPTWVEKMPLIKKPFFSSYSTEDGRCYQICSGWLDKSQSSVFRKVAIRIMDHSHWQFHHPAEALNPLYATEAFPENV